MYDFNRFVVSELTRPFICRSARITSERIDRKVFKTEIKFRKWHFVLRVFEVFNLQFYTIFKLINIIVIIFCVP